MHPDKSADAEFDFAEFDTKTRAELGAKMPLLDMRTGLPKRHPDGTAITISLLGRQSEAFRETLHKVQQRRAADRLATDRYPESETERREREDREFLIACTVDWSFKVMDGQPFPCSPVNIRKLWNDPRFRTVAETAIAFIMADANFLALSPNGSANSPATSSSSAAPFPTTAAASATYSEATA
jgi:hypothetical protein